MLQYKPICGYLTHLVEWCNSPVMWGPHHWLNVIAAFLALVTLIPDVKVMCFRDEPTKDN